MSDESPDLISALASASPEDIAELKKLLGVSTTPEPAAGGVIAAPIAPAATPVTALQFGSTSGSSFLDSMDVVTGINQLPGKFAFVGDMSPLMHKYFNGTLSKADLTIRDGVQAKSVTIAAFSKRLPRSAAQLNRDFSAEQQAAMPPNHFNRFWVAGQNKGRTADGGFLALKCEFVLSYSERAAANAVAPQAQLNAEGDGDGPVDA